LVQPPRSDSNDSALRTRFLRPVRQIAKNVALSLGRNEEARRDSEPESKLPPPTNEPGGPSRVHDFTPKDHPPARLAPGPAIELPHGSPQRPERPHRRGGRVPGGLGQRAVDLRLTRRARQ